ncbi:MAG: hypothetical protein C6W57_16400 [Caldibacillus debilis]|uniref:hypothetical protein n=1 Tax=Caldibacillus debilis TaxID=301148 RepID=UPI000E36E985|nr:hypothetical protein [Caldibacillus debilis]REJ13477.1 MAG: hypothetical protein C6W57_16400 [Caldibacillus debilis]
MEKRQNAHQEGLIWMIEAFQYPKDLNLAVIRGTKKWNRQGFQFFAGIGLAGRQDEAIGFVPLIGAELARSGKMKPIIWYSSIGCLRRTYTPDNLVFLRRLFAETDCPPNLISLPGLMREPHGPAYSVLLRSLRKPYPVSILIPHDERLRVRRPTDD